MSAAKNNQWETVPLGTIAHFRNGINYSKDNFGHGIKVINVKDFQDYLVPKYEDLDEINPEGIIREEYLLQNEDIIFVRSNGNRQLIGRSLFIRDLHEKVTHSAFTIKVRFDSDRVEPRFYAYLFRTSLIRQALSAYGSGTNISNLNQEILSNLQVQMPPLPIQKRIVEILSAYDNLIENNTRRIKLLEDMTQALYREWFVGFRFPGHEKVNMVESELGMIPEGWIRKYADYVDFLEGPGLRNYQYRESGIPFLNIRTLVANDIDFSKVQFLDEDEVKKKYKHFLLEPYDHVVSSSGTIGRIVTIQSWHLPLLLNTSIIRMRPKTMAIGKWQLKHFLQSDYFQNQIRAHAIGAAQMNFGPSHLKQMWIIAPNEELGQQYEKITGTMEELICRLVQKNLNLRRTRDLLLPKLISGEVNITEFHDIKEVSET